MFTFLFFTSLTPEAQRQADYICDTGAGVIDCYCIVVLRFRAIHPTVPAPLPMASSFARRHDSQDLQHPEAEAQVKLRSVD